MTYEEIKSLLPFYTKWKSNIALIYGMDYANKYCTWERFREHIEILKEVENERRG